MGQSFSMEQARKPSPVSSERDSMVLPFISFPGTNAGLNVTFVFKYDESDLNGRAENNSKRQPTIEQIGVCSEERWIPRTIQ